MQFFKENLASSNVIFLGRTYKIEKDGYEYEFFKISSISDSKLHIALDIMQDHYLSIIHSLQNKVDYEMFNKQIFQNSLYGDIQILNILKNQLEAIREIERNRISRLQMSINSSEYELKQQYSPKFEEKSEQSFSPPISPISPTIIKIKGQMDKLLDKISKENLNQIFQLLSIRNDKNETSIINGIISLILNVKCAKPSTCAKYVRNYELFIETLKKFNGCNISKEVYEYIFKDVSTVLSSLNPNIQKSMVSPDKSQIDYSHIGLYRDWLLNALEIVKLFLKENYAEEKEALEKAALKQFNHYQAIKEKIKLIKNDIDNSIEVLIKIGIGTLNDSISFIKLILETDKNSELILGKVCLDNISHVNSEFQKEILILYSHNKYPKKHLNRGDKIRFDENVQIRLKGNSFCFLNDCLTK